MAQSESSLTAALASGPPVVMDGAMGTELIRLGPGIGARDWIGATLGEPGEVRAVHRRYAESGARLHIANTFATARHVLASVGLEDRFEALNRGAVALCREAIAGAGAPQWIAGSVSTYVVGSDRADLPPPASLAANTREQAGLLADAGCDLIALEMLFDTATTTLMMQAAASADLPVSIGLTCVWGPEGQVCLRGEKTGRTPDLPLEAALPEIAAAAAPGVTWVLAIMHSDLDVTDAALDVARRHWTGPIGAYPNSGAHIPPDAWDFGSVCSPGDLVTRARAWAEGGARIIGGCCGIGPDHIRALAKALNGP